jgi:hypothetical protein
MGVKINGLTHLQRFRTAAAIFNGSLGAWMELEDQRAGRVTEARETEHKKKLDAIFEGDPTSVPLSVRPPGIFTCPPPPSVCTPSGRHGYFHLFRTKPYANQPPLHVQL